MDNYLYFFSFDVSLFIMNKWGIFIWKKNTLYWLINLWMMVVCFHSWFFFFFHYVNGGKFDWYIFFFPFFFVEQSRGFINEWLDGLERNILICNCRPVSTMKQNKNGELAAKDPVSSVAEDQIQFQDTRFFTTFVLGRSRWDEI